MIHQLQRAGAVNLIDEEALKNELEEMTDVLKEMDKKVTNMLDRMDKKPVKTFKF